MKSIDKLLVSRNRGTIGNGVIELLAGDLAAIPPEHAVDALVVSAFPKPVIKTVRLYSEKDLPPIMGIYSYIDCAEGDLQRLRDSAATVLGVAR